LSGKTGGVTDHSWVLSHSIMHAEC
jgi:hypothetical protein